jgi:uncharacterized protein YbjT (DUF2867 family)
MSKVIVFGPTGSVASIAAITAQAHGSTVILAMRDLQKTIPGLTHEQEETGGFQRVQADLTDPDSVAAAVQSSGATRAFIYRVHGKRDHMKSTLKAMKSAGINFVVFLSSYTISGDPCDVPPSEVIPYVHAQIELNLDEVYGDEHYVALRPGGFATNMLRFKAGVLAGHVRLYGPDFKFDCITPSDMGRVSGTILATGPKNDQKKVYLYGPQVLTQRDAIGIIGDVLGKHIKVSELNSQEASDEFLRTGVPKPVADYMVRKLGNTADDDNSERKHYEIGVSNVKLYTGRPATSFAEWVKQNRDLFSP